MPRPVTPRKPAAASKPSAARPIFNRSAAHSRDRKPAASSATAGPPGALPTTATTPTGARRTDTPLTVTRPMPFVQRHSPNGSRPAAGARWTANGSAGAKAKHNGNGSHAANGSRPRILGTARAQPMARVRAFVSAEPQLGHPMELQLARRRGVLQHGLQNPRHPPGVSAMPVPAAHGQPASLLPTAAAMDFKDRGHLA